MNDQSALQHTRNWVESVVIALNLCPFAARELNQERIRFSLSDADNVASLLADLEAELQILKQDERIETTLLIHPQILTEFSEYNQFLDILDALLVETGLEGVFQVASFHPAYQFAGTQPDDVSNYTNRSPYPMLHLIREASLEQSVANYPDADQIPQRNIKRLEGMGRDKVLALWQACFST